MMQQIEHQRVMIMLVIVRDRPERSPLCTNLVIKFVTVLSCGSNMEVLVIIVKHIQKFVCVSI